MELATVEVSKLDGDKTVLDVDVPESHDRFVLPAAASGVSVVESVGDIEKNELFDEHEEGEISDDSKPAFEDPESEDNLRSVAPGIARSQNKEGSSSELLCDVSKVEGNVYSRRSARANADGGQRGGWGWRSESATFSSSQPEHFYQIAWAKGIQGSPSDSAGGDSPQDAFKESSVKVHKIDDIDLSAVSWTGNRSLEYLINRNGGWSVGEGAAEFGCFYRNSDGFLIWHEGAELRRGPPSDTWKARTTTKSPIEKGTFLRSTVEKVDRQVSKPSAQEDSLSSSSHDSLLAIPNERQESSANTNNSRANKQRNNRGGELEEGEIEGGGALETILLSDASAIELALERQTRRDLKGRDRHLGKPSERSSSGWRHVSKPRDLHKDRLLSECAELLKNVSLKDAQKSFTGVRRQLHRALKLLRDYVKRSGAEGHRRRVSSLIRQAFSGIRAVYAARSSALSKDEELGMDGFPRLLQLARFNCDKLFTSKQIQELESMIQTVGFPMRDDQSPSKIALPFLEGVDRKRTKYDEASEYMPFMTKHEIENNVDAVESGETSNLLGGKVHPAAAHELVEQVPTEGDCILGETAIATNTGFGGWFSLIPEQVDAQAQANSIDVGSYTCQTSNNFFDLRSHYSENRPALVLVNEKSGRAVQETSSKSYVWPRHIDPVTAATSYHEKFAGKSHMVHMRLPSPTPSDEDEDEDARAVESSDSPVKTDCLHLTQKQSDPNKANRTGVMMSCHEAQPPARAILLSSTDAVAGVPTPILSFAQQEAMVPESTLKEYQRFTASDLNLLPSGDYSSESESRHLEVVKGKSALMLPHKGSRKNRDPRKRLASEPVDLNISQIDDIGSEAIEKFERASEKQKVDQTGTSVPKPQHPLTSFQLPPNLVARTEGLHMHMDPTKGLLFDSAIAQEQHLESLPESSISKRPKIVASTKDADEEGLNKHMSGVSNESQRHGSLGDKVSQQTTSSVRTAIVLRSKATDSSKPRMKPRDPRRVLLGSSSHDKLGDLDTLLSKGDLTSKTGAIVASTQKITSPTLEKAVTAGLDLQIATAELARCVDVEANVCKISQAESLPSMSSSSSSSLVSELSGTPICSVMDRPEDSSGRVASKTFNRGSAAVKVFANANGSVASKLDLNVSATALPNQQQEGASHWSNLEHLLDGLDEQQKQAVREERARRIEEQSRMFSAKKLCLVLDLDHTLLNSAKFTEIEEEWEARLRLNEQTERNKLSKDGFGKRELYRFAHMGMWTKLRPGIWNFLARAPLKSSWSPKGCPGDMPD